MGGQETATDEVIGNGESIKSKEGIEMSDEIKEAVALALAEIEAKKAAAAKKEAEESELKQQVKTLTERLEKVEKTPDNKVPDEPVSITTKGVNYNKTGIGEDGEGTKAFAHYVKTGDEGGIKNLKASNAVAMEYGVDAEGGYAVPTGHHNEIIARRDDSALPVRLGVRRIPGSGTTVNVPYDNEANGIWISTAEEGAYDLDAPALGQAAMTLVKYTKEVRLSNELLQDEDSNLMGFLTDFVGRGFAKLLNNLLITEVGTNGTSLKTFAATTAIAVGEPQDIVGNNDLSNYLDDAGSVGWVTSSSIAWDIYSLTGNPFQYANTPAGNELLPSLLGYPVYYSTEATAVAASAKSIYFGNWNYVGWREGLGMTVLRDPYSNAGTGQISLWYSTRQVFTTLIAEAIGYGVHPSA
jgi:HK97 family phage major capsid protein